MANLIQILRDPKSASDASQILINWNREHAKSFSFGEEISYMNRKDIFKCLLELLHSHSKALPSIEAEKMVVLCLETIRILSRDKTALDECFADENDVRLIFHLAGLLALGDDEAVIIPSVHIDALKCLCNVIYNCASVQGCCKNVDIVKSLLNSLDVIAADGCVDMEAALLSCKILFLVTGFIPAMRKEAWSLGAIKIVSHLIQAKLNKGPEEVAADLLFPDCIIEALKALFNVASSADHQLSDNLPNFEILTDIVRKSILLNSKSKFNDICFQCTAIMTLLPNPCYERLVKPPGHKGEEANLEAIDLLLEHVDYVLTNAPTNDHTVPLFVALARMCRANRDIRRHIRSKVLPPLHESDVRRLPQEGETLRNRICKMLTCPSLEVKEHAADFLFVLCKENVSRLVKYTGFGNAAGLLANRGLLGRAASGSKANGAEYSEDSEASDSEDYSKIRDEINPVTGRVDPPSSKNPFEGMTEEQKEYEAMKLVNAIDKLQRQGIIQPVGFGGEGVGPADAQKPAEHILQMREDFIQLQKKNKKTTSEVKEDEN